MIEKPRARSNRLDVGSVNGIEKVRRVLTFDAKGLRYERVYRKQIDLGVDGVETVCKVFDKKMVLLCCRVVVGGRVAS